MLALLGFSACRWVSQKRVANRPSPALGKHLNKMTNSRQKLLPDFTSKDGIVKITTTTKPWRFPPHDFPVVLLRLHPRKGTRVLKMSDGSVEFMPRFSEIYALCVRMGVHIPTLPPDKPEARRRRFGRLNAVRHDEIST